MSKVVLAVALAVALVSLGAARAWAEVKVTVTREESRPKTVEIKPGEEVRFDNASGGIAHVMFAGSDGVKFYLGTGTNKVKFEKPGTYDYTVHVSGTKVHAHTGSVVVK